MSALEDGKGGMDRSVDTGGVTKFKNEEFKQLLHARANHLLLHVVLSTSFPSFASDIEQSSTVVPEPSYCWVSSTTPAYLSLSQVPSGTKSTPTVMNKPTTHAGVTTGCTAAIRCCLNAVSGDVQVPSRSAAEAAKVAAAWA